MKNLIIILLFYPIIIYSQVNLNNNYVKITDSTAQIGSISPDSTLNVAGGGNFTGGLQVDGKLFLGGTTATASTSQIILKGVDNFGATNRTAMTFGNGGYTTPSSLNAESNGDKWIFWNSTAFKGAIGFDAQTMWCQATGTAEQGVFKWYGGSTSPTQLMRLYRNTLSIGDHIAPNYSLSFGGSIARSVGSERNTVSNTAGNNMNITIGGVTSGSNRKNGGDLIFTSGKSTGAAFSSTIFNRFTRYVVGISATTDNIATMALIINSEKNLVDNTNDTLFSMSIVATATDSIVSGNLIYGVQATNNTDGQGEAGIFNIVGVVKDGVAVVSNTPVFSPAVSAGTLTGTWALTWNNTTKLFYMIVKYDSSLNPSAGKMKMNYILHNSSRSLITQF